MYMGIVYNSNMDIDIIYNVRGMWLWPFTYTVHVVLSGYKPRQTTVTVSDRPTALPVRTSPTHSFIPTYHLCLSSTVAPLSSPFPSGLSTKQVSFSLKVCVFSLHDIELHQPKRKTSHKNNDPVQRRFCLETQEDMTTALSFRCFISTPLITKIKITTNFFFHLL